MVTAKIMCTKKVDLGGDGDDRQTSVEFHADYADDRNKEWARYTPMLSLGMTLKGAVGDLFEQGKAYTLAFEPE